MKKKLLTLLISGALAASAQQKRSVAVEEFDYSAVMTAVQAVFGTQVNIGRGISAMMVKRIAESGKFTVVERMKVDRVLREQDFGASGRVKKGTQARIGQIRGAELALMGDIVVFGRDDRRVGAVAGGAGRGGGAVGGGYKRTDKAVVVLNYRLVDNESSEIVATGEARGESKRSSGGGFLALAGGGFFGGGGFDMSASNFAETIIGEATMDAVNKLVEQLSNQASGVNSQSRDIEISAKVADVNGSTIYITAGSAQGVRVGDRLVVSRITKEIKDPNTGEVLDVAADQLGEVTITQVREKIAIGTFSGSGAPRNGDLVRNK
jgi:curli biogenesis system outer membrane secretion channel CsgG